MTPPTNPFSLDTPASPTEPIAPVGVMPPMGAPGPLDGAPSAGLSPDQGAAPDPQILARNLTAIGGRQPALAKRLAQLTAPSTLRFVTTEEQGALTGELDGRALASRRRPLTEASRLAQGIDIEANGAILVLGMGLGHHCRAIAERADGACAIVLFEPDLALLRAVLERVDHADWLAHGHTVIVPDPDDVGLLSADLTGLDALLSIGIHIVEHAPNRARLGDAGARMISTLTTAVGAMRMHVITAMVQADVTARNQLMNVGHYAARPGIADLEGLCNGRTAILVAAGPSLNSAIQHLSNPEVRERCVIIAVQTVLKPLLDAGITPHFVTAIDYHEISKRFYEGLTPADVEGVTLIAEARANAAILDAFPGDIRLPRDDFLDALLGIGPKNDQPDRGKLPAAATVAHLSYYLARHLGCDPVVLVGQDLAFTDAQYYGPNAAIHNVWASELNPARTLEMLEWERIVRNKGHLHRVTDVLDRPVYTDDQMAAYLAQFERDFAPDAEQGLRIIDASEGVRKRHTTPMPLDQALRAFMPHEPLTPMPGAQANEASRLRRDTADTVRRVKRQSSTIARKARECVRVLEELRDHQRDARRNKTLVQRAHALREEASALQPAFGMLMKLNQLGGFKRFKADRSIALASHEDKYAEQSARIERDIANLEWIDEYAGVLEDLLGASERALQGEPKRTRDVTPSEEEAEHIEVRTQTRVGAVIHTGMSDATSEELHTTLEHLRAAKHLDEIVVLTPDPQSVGARDGVTLERVPPCEPAALRALRAGRAWSLDNWRGGLANLSVFDEALDPAPAAEACVRFGIDSAYVVGADWNEVDAALTDAVIERHRESPKAHPVVFTQAPPGHCGCVVSLAALEEMGHGRTMKRGSMYATLGGVLGYIPLAPRHDPIARPSCVQIDESIRDNATRRIGRLTPDTPTELVIELTTRREVHGTRGASVSTAPVDAVRNAVFERIDVFSDRSPGGLVSFEGRGDPLCIEWLEEAVTHARERGLLVHVRTDLVTEHAAQRVIDAAPDIVSIDAASAEPHTYANITGLDAFDRVKTGIERLLEARSLAGGLPTMWVVPRITKRDDVYTEIESFYDGWLTLTGATIIDALPEPIKGQRIAPLPVPERVQKRHAVRRIIVRADGSEA